MTMSTRDTSGEYTGVHETLHANGVLELLLDLNENNLLSLEAFRTIEATLKRWAQNPSVKVLVLGSAREQFFSNGLDPRNFYQRPPSEIREFVQASVNAMQAIFYFPVPVICAMPGHCLAAGGVMALCADYRYMRQRGGRIGYPEANIGLNFPGLASRRLRELVGERHARDLLYEAKLLRPADAVAIGLVDAVFAAKTLDEFYAQVRKVADRLARAPRVSLKGIKDGLRRDYADSVYETSIFDVNELVKTVLTPTAQEGILSLIEQRRPDFAGLE